jgi:DNA polymerase III subunit epsilon
MSTDTRKLIFVDIETTGLDRDRHQIVEIAWAALIGPINVVRPRHTLAFAQPEALQVNRYYARQLWKRPSSADEISRFILDARDSTVVAANPAFDCGFLQSHFGHAPWHYRLSDIESFAAGVLGLEAPPSLRTIRELLSSLGYTIAEADHSAGTDVASLRDCWQALRAEQHKTWVVRPELVAAWS